MKKIALAAAVAMTIMAGQAFAAPDNVDPQTPLCTTAAHQRLCSTVLRLTVKKLDPGDAPILNLLIHKDGGVGQTVASIARDAYQDIVRDITVNWVDRQHEHLLDVIDSGNIIRVLKYTHGQDKALPFLAYPAADSGHFACVWRAIPSGGSWIYNYLYFATVGGVQQPFWTSDPNSCQLFTHIAADTGAGIGQVTYNDYTMGRNPSVSILPSGLYVNGMQSCYLKETTTSGTLYWNLFPDSTYTPDGMKIWGNWYFSGVAYEFQDCGAATMLAGVGNDAAAYAASGMSGVVYGATKQ